MTGGNPQVEDGYTRIANELLDALISADLSKRERKVIDVIMRFSYGCGKKWVEISLGDLALLTSLTKHDSLMTLKALEEKCLIANPRPGIYQLNKRYLEWKVRRLANKELFDARVRSVLRKNIPQTDKHPEGDVNHTRGEGVKHTPKGDLKYTSHGDVKYTPKVAVTYCQDCEILDRKKYIKENVKKNNIPPYNPPIRGDLSPLSSFSAQREGNEPEISNFQKESFQQQVIELYHKILFMCPKVKVWGKRSQKNLLNRCLENPKFQTLEGWKGFFRKVADSSFLTGKKSDFIATLDWLVRPTNFEKVLNGRYSHELDEISAGIEAWAQKKGHKVTKGGQDEDQE